MELARFIEEQHRAEAAPQMASRPDKNGDPDAPAPPPGPATLVATPAPVLVPLPAPETWDQARLWVRCEVWSGDPDQISEGPDHIGGHRAARYLGGQRAAVGSSSRWTFQPKVPTPDHDLLHSESADIH